MQPLAYSCHGTRLEGGKSNINTIIAPQNIRKIQNSTSVVA